MTWSTLIRILCVIVVHVHSKMLKLVKLYDWLLFYPAVQSRNNCLYMSLFNGNTLVFSTKAVRAQAIKENRVGINGAWAPVLGRVFLQKKPLQFEFEALRTSRVVHNGRKIHEVNKGLTPVRPTSSLWARAAAWPKRSRCLKRHDICTDLQLCPRRRCSLYHYAL